MSRILRDHLKAPHPIWQILDWPSILVFGLMMDGKLTCQSDLFCTAQVFVCSNPVLSPGVNNFIKGFMGA